MREFENKIVWVTGGTKGIGRRIVEGFLEEGATVITNCTGSNLSEMEEFETSTKDKSVKLFAANLCDEKQISELVDSIKNQYGRIDILVNNAGISVDGYIEDYDVSDFRRVLDTNVCGKYLALQKSIPLLKKSDYPSVVNISSRLSVMPMEQSVAYCCSQAAVSMMTKVAVLELSKYNIRINTISPSLTETELSLSFYSEEELVATRLNNPRNRLGKTSDVFGVVKFLCSKDADYINGGNIHVNGGGVLV